MTEFVFPECAPSCQRKVGVYEPHQGSMRALGSPRRHLCHAALSIELVGCSSQVCPYRLETTSWGGLRCCVYFLLAFLSNETGCSLVGGSIFSAWAHACTSLVPPSTCVCPVSIWGRVSLDGCRVPPKVPCEESRSISPISSSG